MGEPSPVTQKQMPETTGGPALDGPQQIAWGFSPTHAYPLDNGRANGPRYLSPAQRAGILARTRFQRANGPRYLPWRKGVLLALREILLVEQRLPPAEVRRLEQQLLAIGQRDTLRRLDVVLGPGLLGGAVFQNQ